MAKLVNGHLETGDRLTNGHLETSAAADTGFKPYFVQDDLEVINMRKNVAGQFIGSQMTTIADGTDFTGTVTAEVTVDGGTKTAGGGTVVHEGEGYHSYALTQAETNGDHIAVSFAGTAALSTTKQAWTSFPQTVDNNVLAAGVTGFAAIDTVVDAILVDTAEMQPLVAKIPLSDGTITWNATALGSVNAECDTAISDAALATATNLATVDSNVDAILVDTAVIGVAGAGLTDLGGMSTTMKGQVNTEADTALTDYDGPTNAEMEARTLVAAAYFDASADTVVNVTNVATLTGHTVQTGDSFARIGAPAGASVSADIADVPTVAEFNARTLVAASYFDPVNDDVAVVTLVTTTTTNTDMRGTDGVAGALVSGTSDSGSTTTMVDAVRTEADTDYWKDSLILFTSGNLSGQARLITGFNAGTDTITFAPATTQAVTTQTYEIHQWGNIDLVNTTTTNTDMVGTDSALLATNYVDHTAAIADLPTVAEFNARTLVAASYFDPVTDAVANVTLVATTTAVTNQVTANVTAISGDSVAADNLEASLETIIASTATGTPTTTTMPDSSLTEATDDHYVGRIIIWRTGALAGQATDITGYNGTTKTFTFTATTNAASAGDAYAML